MELADVVRFCSDIICKQSLLFPFLYSVCRQPNRGVRGGSASHAKLERDMLFTCLFGKDAVGVEFVVVLNNNNNKKTATIEHHFFKKNVVVITGEKAMEK